MDGQRTVQALVTVILVMLILEDVVESMNPSEKRQLREKVVEMFNHGYNNYMEHAYPADELMPLSCKGRYRGSEASRGDVDDVLGNFSVTLVDSLDTLVVLGQIEEFERAVQLVIEDINFDNDIVVSVFETNIRMLGGLLGGHVMAEYLLKSGQGMSWYSGQLLEKAKEIGYRLLPAFNTTTGIPFPRVNLKHGVNKEQARTGHEKDTCTSCAGTLILEFAALSRLSGDPIFEQKAAKALDIIWQQRHRMSDLVGLVINVHNGDWVRRESGVGAGIDSYYEYLLKAYILLGDENYLDRFNQHYEAVMKYISQGPLMLDVHMHKPLTNSRNFMDSLLAFWPGLQVLKGDIRPAIETHEMLYQVMQRHNFLPEAFTADFRVHWGQHPLRPEFVESTYFLYKATSDPHYLEVGKSILENLDRHARVDCGFAAIKDVTTGAHEDQMDSFVLAETFKYLYLLFSEDDELIFPVDDYIFTTEAHLLPLTLSIYKGVNLTKNAPPISFVISDAEEERRTCPNTHYLFPGNSNYAQSVRSPLKNMVENLCPKPRSRRKPRLRALEFTAGNKDQLEDLRRMGIRIATMKDGRVQLLHTASEASSPDDAEDGMMFMQEMIELSKTQQQEVQQEPRVVQLLTPPYFGQTVLNAGPAQFGYDLKTGSGVQGHLAEAVPFRACQPMQNAEELFGKIVLMERGDCMFIDKARHIQAVGAVGGIVIDNTDGSTSTTSPLFAMSGDGKNDITIPLIFLFSEEGRQLRDALKENQRLEIYIGYKEKRPEQVMQELLDKQEAVNRAAKTRQSDDSMKSPLGENGQSEDSAHQPSCQTQTEPAEPEADAAKLLLHKYMKKMKLGDLHVQIKQNFPMNKDAERLLTIIEGPNNARQVSMQLDQLVTEEAEKKIGEVYEELVSLLMSHTNFANLEDQNMYLKAIGDLVEAAFTDGKGGLDMESQDALDRLAGQLRPNDEEQEPDEDSSDSESDYLLLDESEEEGESDGREDYEMEESYALDSDEEEGVRSYATASDLDAGGGEPMKPPLATKAPEWMKLKPGEVFVDKDGIMYSNDGEEDSEKDLPLCDERTRDEATLPDIDVPAEEPVAQVDNVANAWSLDVELQPVDTSPNRGEDGAKHTNKPQYSSEQLSNKGQADKDLQNLQSASHTDDRTFKPSDGTRQSSEPSDIEQSSNSGKDEL